MQHQIHLETLGPQGPEMTHAIEKCVHCGFCLSACPTYKVMGEEMDSPRGRIYLMKEQMESSLSLDSTLPYTDRCLGCMACVTACPSGVEYGELLMPFRSTAEEERTRSPMERLTRLLVRETLPYPERFRLAASMGRLARPLQGLLPEPLGSMLQLLPDSLPKRSTFPKLIPARGKRRAKVAMLVGCVQQVLAPEINEDTIEVLTQNGVDILIPEGQGCCGSLSMHTGMANQAQSLAAHNISLFLPLLRSGSIDAIITNAAGCGSGMKEYGLLFKGSDLEADAREFAQGVQDVSVFLAHLGLVEPPPLPTDLNVAYHDACHLAHAQRVTSQPRQLLRSIPNVSLLEINEGDLCCGSAGTYNLEQPDLARQIGLRKAENIMQTGADLVVTGNIGCMTQIQSHLQELGQPIPVQHTMGLLAAAYRSNR
ncbi:MAG: glycolate oxidase subunit GlcF [Chloroflexota bacterium]